MNRFGRRLVPALLCAGLPLCAQDVAWGVHASVNLPQGDLKTALDSKMGFSAGGHVAFYLQDGHEIRPRIDYTRYDGGTFSTRSLTYKNIVTALGLGGDYVFYLQGRQQGAYVLGGLGYQSWSVEPKDTPKTTQGSIAYQAGFGYRLNPRVAAEVAFVSSKFQKTDGQGTAITAGMSIRF